MFIILCTVLISSYKIIMTTIRLQLLVESLQIIITQLNFETFVLFQVDKN